LQGNRNRCHQPTSRCPKAAKGGGEADEKKGPSQVRHINEGQGKKIKPQNTKLGRSAVNEDSSNDELMGKKRMMVAISSFSVSIISSSQFHSRPTSQRRIKVWANPGDSRSGNSGDRPIASVPIRPRSPQLLNSDDPKSGMPRLLQPRKSYKQIQSKGCDYEFQAPLANVLSNKCFHYANRLATLALVYIIILTSAAQVVALVS
jgi:hypothetical protein